MSKITVKAYFKPFVSYVIGIVHGLVTISIAYPIFFLVVLLSRPFWLSVNESAFSLFVDIVTVAIAAAVSVLVVRYFIKYVDSPLRCAIATPCALLAIQLIQYGIAEPMLIVFDMLPWLVYVPVTYYMMSASKRFLLR